VLNVEGGTCIEAFGSVDHGLLAVLFLLVITHTTLTYYLLRGMGFEEAVPPVPDRLAEVKMLDRLEESWLAQPYNRYYMQEDLRQTKMEYAQYNLKVRCLSRRLARSFFSTASS
jgi:hypothetical protein